MTKIFIIARLLLDNKLVTLKKKENFFNSFFLSKVTIAKQRQYILTRLTNFYVLDVMDNHDFKRHHNETVKVGEASGKTKKCIIIRSTKTSPERFV